MQNDFPENITHVTNPFPFWSLAHLPSKRVHQLHRPFVPKQHEKDTISVTAFLHKIVSMHSMKINFGLSNNQNDTIPGKTYFMLAIFKR